MTDIAQFLAARLDEDQVAAEEAMAKVKRTGFWSGVDLGPAIARLLFHQRFTPPRILAEVAAKRRVLARHYGSASTPLRAICEGCAYNYADIDPRYYLDECPELRDLAAPYDAHPDFDPAWRVPTTEENRS